MSCPYHFKIVTGMPYLILLLLFLLIRKNLVLFGGLHIAEDLLRSLGAQRQAPKKFPQQDM
jgi:hypothetical protein